LMQSTGQERSRVTRCALGADGVQVLRRDRRWVRTGHRRQASRASMQSRLVDPGHLGRRFHAVPRDSAAIRRDLKICEHVMVAAPARRHWLISAAPLAIAGGSAGHPGSEAGALGLRQPPKASSSRRRSGAGAVFMSFDADAGRGAGIGGTARRSPCRRERAKPSLPSENAKAHFTGLQMATTTITHGQPAKFGHKPRECRENVSCPSSTHIEARAK